MSYPRTTVGELLEKLNGFPLDMPVVVRLSGGGGVSVERRDLVEKSRDLSDVKSEQVIAIYASNGGSFGHEPLTEEEYRKQSHEFLSGLFDEYRLHYGFRRGVKRYTTDFGDHRIYYDFGGSQDGCYGTGYDDRVVKRLVDEGYLETFKQVCSRDGVRLTNKGRAVFASENAYRLPLG